MLDSMDLGDAQLCSHHHIHQETDLRGSQGHISGMSHDKWLETLTDDPSRVSGICKDRDDVSLSMLRFVYMLFPQRGVFQIVEDRFLAGSAFLLVLHPHNCVLHAKIQGKQRC